jgi:poly(A) polymerase
MLDPKQVSTTFTINPAANIVNYIKGKCGLPQDQIEKKLMNGEAFEMIKGEGNDIDTKLMEEILNENDFYEKHSQKILKDEAMKFICDVVEQWSIWIAKHEMRINEDEIYQYTAKLLPFGSYVLDLRSNSSDIDLICVCPNFVTREHHFFVRLAEELLSKADIKHLATRTNAKVPIITFEYKDINIDISFCQLQTETVPRDIEKIISLELLNTIKDEQSRTSLIGRKNNLMILELAGKQTENFKQTLRVIKVWAKNRGISSNGMGYLGGISWAILVAKICQIFPNHKPTKLFYEFFAVYSIWNWKVPVRLIPPSGPIDEKSTPPLMSVITPASEYNSTERVNAITEQVLVSEIRRAAEILSARKDIADVCKKVDFFSNFPLFIEMDIYGLGSSKEEEKDYKDFQGLVESRILKLLSIILRHYKSNIENGSFKIVPFPKMFKKTYLPL